MARSSTCLYAVDLDQLRAACGSKDLSLIDRVFAAEAAEDDGDGKDRHVDETKGPRILVTWKSELYLNGQPVTKDELMRAMLDPKWRGTMFYECIEKPPPGEIRKGEFSEPGSFFDFIRGTFATYLVEHGTTIRQFCGIQGVSTREELENLGMSEDEISDDDALIDLINGNFTKPNCGSDYGYALERLCHALGTFLDTLGTNKLKSLKLKTSLSKTRSPVKLPKYSGAPSISYLERNEVPAEYQYCHSEVGDAAVDDDNDDLEYRDERQVFVRCLREAVDTGRGMVGFYY